MSVWYVITMLAPCVLASIGWTYGNKIAQANKQAMGASTVELQLHRFREEYAHDEIDLPALEKAVEMALQGMPLTPYVSYARTSIGGHNTPNVIYRKVT
jgi:hypothetical protein